MKALKTSWAILWCTNEESQVEDHLMRVHEIIKDEFTKGDNVDGFCHMAKDKITCNENLKVNDSNKREEEGEMIEDIHGR